MGVEDSLGVYFGEGFISIKALKVCDTLLTVVVEVSEFSELSEVQSLHCVFRPDKNKLIVTGIAESPIQLFLDQTHHQNRILLLFHCDFFFGEMIDEDFRLVHMVHRFLDQF